MPDSSAKRQSQDLVLPHEKRLRTESGQQNAEHGVTRPRATRIRLTRYVSELGAWRLDFDNSPGFVVVPARDRQYRFNYQDTSGIIMELSNKPHAFCGRQIQPQVDLSLLKGWLEFCNINHKTLCRKFDPRLPQGFRVIDCLTRRIVSWETVARPKSYIALSYVWGNHVKDATTSKDSPLGPLPATIEDAILLTIGLGYQYLWIDRYCISQDNPIERQLQIQNMNAIYEQSVVTVIAAAGDDPYHGLPGVSATPRKSQPHVKIGSRTFISTPYVKNEILQSKWNSRGWTYQEGLLSRRRLVFTDTQIYFQCNSMHCLESIYAPLEILHTFKNNRMRDQVEMSRVFLRICGLTLDVQIYPDGRISATEDEGGIVEYLMVQLSTEAFRKCAVQHTRSAYDIKEDKDNPLPFTFLVISHSDYELVLLLLYHPENSLGFERIDACLAELFVSKDHRWTALLTELFSGITAL
ncbi:uncharacterized protein PAC_15332 [Phialocephala subalpina]|uniref:Heterokaryon incompatibility domain-containing protein n=1 Tax=Phialocephala subalpina TaxID=576137 RepID=A0A1L7XK62_9HELO|nr:uncharacterized protein PAC_15332 [Phialocephala subalpina]